MKKDNIKYLTHIFDYNKLTNGLHEEELTIIGARPGVGKTTFALELAYTIAKKGVYTAFLSLEMSSNQLIQKLLSNITGIDSNTIRTGNVEEEQLQTLVHVASNHLSSVPLYINNKCFNIQDIELIIRKLKNQNNLGLVVIDYLQLVRSKSKFANREQEVADVSRTLKLLALELKIPIVALCQLGRNAQRTKPTLADLRESGAIEQDADNVILLYKENEESLKFVEDVMLYLAKQRAGITGTIKIRFDKRKSKFNNIEG